MRERTYLVNVYYSIVILLTDNFLNPFIRQRFPNLFK